MDSLPSPGGLEGLLNLGFRLALPELRPHGVMTGPEVLDLHRFHAASVHRQQMSIQVEDLDTVAAAVDDGLKFVQAEVTRLWEPFRHQDRTPSRSGGFLPRHRSSRWEEEAGESGPYSWTEYKRFGHSTVLGQALKTWLRSVPCDQCSDTGLLHWSQGTLENGSCCAAPRSPLRLAGAQSPETSISFEMVFLLPPVHGQIDLEHLLVQLLKKIPLAILLLSLQYDVFLRRLSIEAHRILMSVALMEQYEFILLDEVTREQRAKSLDVLLSRLP
ncbi:hypothetical protein QYS50_22075 (plasmid) [Deinococcus altitudinis]